MPASVLLITSDPAQQAALAAVLHPPGYLIAVAPADDALALAAQYDVLILDTTADQAAMVHLCRTTRQDPALGQVPLLVVSQSNDVEERIQYLEAGADDVIGRPYDPRELEARVEALVTRFAHARGVATPIVHDRTVLGARRTIAVFSPKGGVGTTTIATNLAIIAGSRKPDTALLIDLDLQFGGVAVHLDLRPRQTIVDLVRDDAALSDPELLRGYAVRHESGLHVLAGTTSPEQTELVHPAQLGQLLRTVKAAYETIVIDGGSILDERALQVLEWADSVILPFHPEIPALKAVHSLLDYLNTTGQIAAKSVFVLNNAFARQALRLDDIELALGTKVANELAYDPLAYLNAANEGVPLVIGSPRSAAALKLIGLADALFGEQVAMPEAPTPQPRGLAGLLRRRSN